MSEFEPKHIGTLPDRVALLLEACQSQCMVTCGKLALCSVLWGSPSAAVMQADPGSIVVTLPAPPAISGVRPSRVPCVPTPMAAGPNGRPGHPGDRLRSALGLKVPEASSLVIIHGVAIHHISEQWSIVAWRDEDARWTVQKGGESGSGLLKQERVVFPVETAVLPADASSILDALLDETSLFEETPLGDEPSVGSTDSTMEIIRPGGSKTSCWSGKLYGKLGAVVDRLIGQY